jgi:hypothetical protein
MKIVMQNGLMKHSRASSLGSAVKLDDLHRLISLFSAKGPNFFGNGRKLTGQ